MKDTIWKKMIFALFFAFGLLLLMSVKSNAATLSISTTKSSVAPGETFTVTVTLSGGAGKVSSGGRTEWLDNSSFSYTLTAGASGSVPISASGTVGDYATERDQPVSASKSVRIVQSSNGGNSGGNSGGNTNTGGNSGNTGGNIGNSNNTSAPTLATFGTSPYDFKWFSPSKTSYSVAVPTDCTSINVYATSKNGTVSGTGSKTLKDGSNVFKVTVSNSAGSKTYSVNVIKKSSEDGEEVPNVIEGEETEGQENVAVFGLASLEIEGYTLDKEFKTDVYEYTVIVDKKLTLAELDQIKEKIKAVASDENLTVEAVSNVSEAGVATITIVVKDAEKEYSRYVITFETEKKDTKVAGIIKSNYDNFIGMFGLTDEQQIYAILGGIGLITLFALTFAFTNYLKSRKLAEYKETELQKEDANFDFVKQYYTEDESKTVSNNDENMVADRSTEITEEPSIAETIEDVTTTLRKTRGYRRLARGSRSYGKH